MRGRSNAAIDCVKVCISFTWSSRVFPTGRLINISNLSMLEFPPELIAHKGNVFYLLYVAGGLLITATAGGRCVDVAVRTAQNPDTLLRLSNTLVGLMGLRSQIKAANCVVKQRLKRLYFAESLLDMTRLSLRDTSDFRVLWAFPEKQTNLESTPANWISANRCRIYYILLCGGSSQHILTLCIRGGGGKLKAYTSSNRLRWLMSFGRMAQARGDVIFLLLGGQTEQIGSDTSGATNEPYPTCLTLGLSALSVVLLWMFLPHIAVCAVICVGWMVQQHVR